MSHADVLERSPNLVLSRWCATSTERAELARRVNGGELTRIMRGAYVPTPYWKSLDRHAKYRLQVLASIVLSGRDQVVSHASAAALWRLPWIPGWPPRTHVTASGNMASSALFARHRARTEGQLEVIDGTFVTSLAQTVIDVAATESFETAVAAADAALRRRLHPEPGLPASTVTRETLLADLPGLALNHGRARALQVVEFADERSDRPGESLSRVTMKRAHISTPELQVELRGGSGKKYFVDFWWPEFDAFGEFDGRYKYSDPEFLAGRTPAQAVYDEKLREDDLRSPGRRCARWEWQVAGSVQLLRARLMRAGVR